MDYDYPFPFRVDGYHLSISAQRHTVSMGIKPVRRLFLFET